MRSMSTLWSIQLILCLSLFVGCTLPEKKIMDSQKGHHKDQLFKRWGAPDKEETLQDGRSVYTWHHNWSTQQGKGTCTKSVTADHKGIIVNGNFHDCPLGAHYQLEKK
ncbi:MAG: hypothetical protein GKS05_08885 [Nitrospirales bacterium]|nr:hypothetical protein [Nitrospirales bacterium]